MPARTRKWTVTIFLSASTTCFARRCVLRLAWPSARQKSPGGLGSLGRRRFIAVETRAKGVYDAREAKALAPSALYWLRQQDGMPSQTATLLQHALRIPDPFFQVHDHWLIRQLAPDIAKIEMPADPK